MFSALAATIAPRRRGLVSGSPPFLAAIEISLIRRVKILPRLASKAPFLCLIVAHFEWPDMEIPRNLVVFKGAELVRRGDQRIASNECRRSKIIAWDSRGWDSEYGPAGPYTHTLPPAMAGPAAPPRTESRSPERSAPEWRPRSVLWPCAS